MTSLMKHPQQKKKKTQTPIKKNIKHIFNNPYETKTLKKQNLTNITCKEMKKQKNIPRTGKLKKFPCV